MLKPSQFKQSSKAVVEWIDHYLNQVGEYPVKSQLEPGQVYRQIPPKAPDKGEEMDLILEDLDRIIIPGITHWQHPNFHAYFPANNSVESVLGEFITSAIGAQCMIWETSPAAAELEQRMMEWLRDAMALPSQFEGVIQDSASSASLTALLTAREVSTNFRSNDEGVPANLRVYCSRETHSSIEKGLGICGVGRNNLVKIPVDGQMAMQVPALRAAIKSDLAAGKKPMAVVACIGTTGTLAVDPLEEIARVCREHRIWLHVDAAYAGSALLLPEYAWMAKGMEHADSLVFNPHKWMFTNFDCSVYFIRQADLLIRTFEILPEYLKTSTRGRVNDYRDWGVPLGRRFRALKLWLVLRSFGLEGLRKKLRNHIELTLSFALALEAHPDIEIIHKAFLNFVGFRLHPKGIDNEEQLNRLNASFLDLINKRGKLFLSHTKTDGAMLIRVVIGQTYVEKADVDRSLKEILDVAKLITESC